MATSPSSSAATWLSDLDSASPSASASDRDHPARRAPSTVRPDSSATWDAGRYTYDESFAVKPPLLAGTHAAASSATAAAAAADAAKPSTLTGSGPGHSQRASPPTIRIQPNFDGHEPDSPGRSVLIVVLRYDLRIHDNALFYYAHQTFAPPMPAWMSSLVSSPQSVPGAAEQGPAAEVPARDAFEADAAREQFLCSQSQYLLPLYVFDEREMELSGLPGYRRDGPQAKTPLYGFWKTGRFRARFIAETVYDLRSRLSDRGSDLLIRFGKTEDIVSSLVASLQANGDVVESVWTQLEYAQPDVNWNTTIHKRLANLGVPFEYVYGKTLIHPAELPFPVSETPDVFTPFRKKVEALESRMVRPTLEAPNRFKPFLPSLPDFDGYALDITYEVDVDGLDVNRSRESEEQDESQTSFHDVLRYLLSPLVGKLPSSKDRSALQARHAASAFPFRGGESSALERLEWYFIRGKRADTGRWDRNDPPPVAQYKQTRNNLIGHAYSSKMSPFLAFGSVSPRLIWEALDYHEKRFGEDQNTYWVRFELLWRDYFLFVASKQKYGPLLYDLGGFQTVTDPTRAAEKLQPGWWRGWDPEADGYTNEITRLLDGRTGIPFIDANVIEVRATAFMSNRGRQNVASFLSKDLGADWRIGAEFFQSYLIDYDPTSNYGNWQYVAGVGNDPRASRQFNTIKQCKDYDVHGEYVKTWLPVLRNLPSDYVQTPWLLTPDERRAYGVKSTKTEVTMLGYPERPMVELESWRKHYERRNGAGSKMRGNPQEKIKDEKIYALKANAARRRRAVQQEQNQLSSSFNGHMHMQLPRCVSGLGGVSGHTHPHAGQGHGLGFDRAQSAMMQSRSQSTGKQHGFGLAAQQTQPSISPVARPPISSASAARSFQGGRGGGPTALASPAPSAGSGALVAVNSPIGSSISSSIGSAPSTNILPGGGASTPPAPFHSHSPSLSHPLTHSQLHTQSPSHSHSHLPALSLSHSRSHSSSLLSGPTANVTPFPDPRVYQLGGNNVYPNMDSYDYLSSNSGAPSAHYKQPLHSVHPLAPAHAHVPTPTAGDTAGLTDRLRTTSLDIALRGLPLAPPPMHKQVPTHALASLGAPGALPPLPGCNPVMPGPAPGNVAFSAASSRRRPHSGINGGVLPIPKPSRAPVRPFPPTDPTPSSGSGSGSGSGPGSGPGSGSSVGHPPASAGALGAIGTGPNMAPVDHAMPFYSRADAEPRWR